jgi:hypothetical protein
VFDYRGATATCAQLRIGIATGKDRFHNSFDDYSPNLLSAINAILSSHRPDSRAGGAPIWVDLHLVILRYSREREDILIAPGRSDGVPAAASSKIASRHPADVDARELSRQIASDGALFHRMTLSTGVAPCHVRQHLHNPRSFPLMRVQSAGYYGFVLHLITICGTSNFFVCSTETIYDISPLLRKIIFKIVRYGAIYVCRKCLLSADFLGFHTIFSGY